MPACAPLQSFVLYVAALPALPVGKGAVILILGGLVALAVSLAWSLFSPRAAAVPHAARTSPGRAPPPPPRKVARAFARRAQPAAAPRMAPASSGRARSATTRGGVAVEQMLRAGAPAVELPTWLERVSDATVRMGFGSLRVVGVEGARVLVALTACRSCRRRGGSGAGCALEARSLGRAARTFAPHAVATEVRCQQRGDSGCVFELRPEGSA